MRKVKIIEANRPGDMSSGFQTFECAVCGRRDFTNFEGLNEHVKGCREIVALKKQVADLVGALGALSRVGIGAGKC